MSDDEIINTALATADQVEAEFISEYGRVEDDKNYRNLILGIILVMILGSKFLKKKSYNIPPSLLNKLPSNYKQKPFVLSKENKQNLTDLFGSYKGAKSSIRKIVGNQLTIAMLIRQAKKRQKEVLENNIKQNGMAVLAIDNGFDYVTARTRGDSRVRPEHRNNNGRIWRADDYQPWHDFNCRCTYTFGKSRASLTK